MKKIYVIGFALFFMVIGITMPSFATDVNNFQELKNAVGGALNNEEIVINSSFEIEEKINISNKSITIKGRDDTIVLNRKDSFLDCFFNVEQTGGLTIKNIILDGGAPNFEPDLENRYYDTSGYIVIPIKNDNLDIKSKNSMIVSYGVLNIEEATLRNNYNSIYNKYGGAVRTLKGTISIKNSNIKHNLSIRGAGVSSENSVSLNIDNVNFIDNYGYSTSGNSFGGGIQIYNVNNVEVKKSKFINNSVNKRNGGAIFVYSKATSDVYDFKIEECDFQDNKCGNDGGAIEFSGTGEPNIKADIVKCMFINNKALAEKGQSLGSSISSIVLGLNTKYNIKECTFDGNKSAGGVFTDHGTGPSVDFEKCTFKNNYANDGSVLYSLLGYYNFDNCEFFDNTANNTGMIYLMSRSAKTTETKYKEPYINIKECEIYKNSVNTAGIICIMTRDGYKTAKCQIEDTNIYKNEGKTGIIAIQNSNIDLKNNVKIKNNTVTSYAGGIYIMKNSTCDISGNDIEISGNEAKSNAGGILNNSSTLNITGKNIKIEENKVTDGKGGGIYSTGIINTSGDSRIIVCDNEANEEGGGIYISSTSTGVTDLSNMEIYNNKSNKAGDDIYSEANIILNNLKDKGLKLKDKTDITGWFYDGYERLEDSTEIYKRWSDKDTDKYIKLFEGIFPVNISEKIALKAAHGEIKKDENNQEQNNQNNEENEKDKDNKGNIENKEEQNEIKQDIIEDIIQIENKIPITGDKIGLYIIVLSLSIISIMSIIIYKIKFKK